jgi:hypothetical protein
MLDRRGVDVLELLIAVGVAAAFQDLAIGLQAVAHLVKQSTDQAGADLVPHLCQLGGQLAGALARPTQRRLRIAATAGLHQALEIAAKGRVLVDRSLASGSSRRTRSSAISSGWWSSLTPRAIVVLARPVARDTAARLLGPRATVSEATMSRRLRSSKCGDNAA